MEDKKDINQEPIEPNEFELHLLPMGMYLYDNFTWYIDEDYIDTIVRNFNVWTSLGQKIPLTKDHPYENDPFGTNIASMTVGYLLACEKREKGLFARATFTDPEFFELVKNGIIEKVSIGIIENPLTVTSAILNPPIMYHVALTMYPRFAEQNPIKRLLGIFKSQKTSYEINRVDSENINIGGSEEMDSKILEEKNLAIQTLQTETTKKDEAIKTLSLKLAEKEAKEFNDEVKKLGLSDELTNKIIETTKDISNKSDVIKLLAILPLAKPTTDKVLSISSPDTTATEEEKKLAIQELKRFGVKDPEKYVSENWEKIQKEIKESNNA